MTRLASALAALTLLLAPALAHADDAPAPRPERHVYAGGAITAIPIVYGEAYLDAGWRLPPVPWLLVHGSIVAGGDTMGDFSTDEWNTVTAGLEARYGSRRFRAVIGLDVGARWNEHWDEGTGDETYTTESEYTWRVLGEVGDTVVFRFGIQGTKHLDNEPLPMLGVAVRF